MESRSQRSPNRLRAADLRPSLPPPQALQGGGSALHSFPLLSRPRNPVKQTKTKTKTTKEARREGEIPPVSRKLPCFFLAGGAHKSGSSLEGGGSLQAKGRKLEVAFSPSTTTSITIKVALSTSPPARPSGGASAPRPRRWGCGAGPNAPALLSKPALLTFFFFFFLFSLFFQLFICFFFSIFSFFYFFFCFLYFFPLSLSSPRPFFSPPAPFSR